MTFMGQAILILGRAAGEGNDGWVTNMIGLVNDHEPAPGAFDPSRPNVARMYDYLLGGKDNFAPDRLLGDRIVASLPTVQVGVREQRALLGRVVRYLVEEAGIRQLIDIGSGLPTASNVHEIAQRLDPQTRVVYVDNDPRRLLGPDQG